MVRCLDTHYPEDFRRIFGTHRAQRFWETCSMSDPKFSGHPMLDVPNWKETFIPIWIHGDGGEFQQRDSVSVVSWGCFLTAVDSVWGSIFYMTSWPLGVQAS
eukprot:4569291-Karenia_brevis.AAC.2